MLEAKVLQQLPVKSILIVLLVLEGACIALGSSINFDDYISIVVIILAFFIAYFAYRYLTSLHYATKYFQAINEVTPIQQLHSHTEKQVEKLVKSQEYRKFEKNWRNKQLNISSAELITQAQPQEQAKKQEFQAVVEELLQNQGKIFDL